MPQLPRAKHRSANPDTPAVDEAERKVAAVLDDLEEGTDAEVKDIDLEDLVDTDTQGRPVVKKGVDITVEHRPKRNWAR
jgi:hypothetical protein